MNPDGTVHPSAPRARRRGLPVGVIGAATLIAGAFGYALILLAARLVSQDDYARFLTIWGVIFGLGSALSVVEQELARQATLASLTSHRQVGREAILAAVVAAALALFVLVILTFTPLRHVLLGSNGIILGLAAASTIGFAAQYATRGILIGNGVVMTYGFLVVTEAFIRIAVAAIVAVAVTDGRLTWLVAAIAAGPFAWVTATRRVRPFITMSSDGPPLGPIIRRMLVLGASTGLTACLLTGYPAIVTAVTGTSTGLATLFAVISATRVPLLLLTPIQALTVPTVVRAARHPDGGTLRRMFERAIVITVIAMIGTGVIGWLIGPWAVQILFGSGYHPPAWMTMALAASTVIIGAAQLCTAALLALSHFSATAISWASGVATVILLLVVLPGDTATRAVAALVGASVIVVLVAGLLLHRAIAGGLVPAPDDASREVPHSLSAPSAVGQNGLMCLRRAIVPLLAVSAALLVGLAWTLSSPAGSSPDDNYHLPAILCPPPAAHSGCRLVKDAAGNVTAVYVPARFAQAANCFAFDNTRSAACKSELPTTDVPVGIIDQGGYPGPYYAVMHHLARDDVDSTVIVIRMANVLLAVFLLGAALIVMEPERRRFAATVLIVAAVPLALFITASDNPSSWAITGVTAAWLGCFTLWTTPSRRRAVAASILLIVAAIIAATSRSDAAAYLVLSMICLAVLFGRRILTFRRRFIAPGLVVMIAAASFLTAGQSGALTSTLETAAGRPGKAVLFNNLLELPSLVGGWFGLGWGLGWLDTRMPAIAAFGGFAAAVALMTIGLSRHFRGKAIALTIAVGAIAFLALYILQREHGLIGENVQPRYFLPLLPLILGLTLVRDRFGETVTIDRFRGGLIAVALIIAQSAALHANIRRYVTGQDVYSFNLNRDVEWWWGSGPSPLGVWALGTIAFALLVGLAMMRGYPRARSGSPAESPPPNP